MNGKRYLPLQRGGGGGDGTNDDDIRNIQHEIRFGNSPLICRVTCNPTADEKAESSGSIPPSMMMMNAIDIGDDLELAETTTMTTSPRLQIKRRITKPLMTKLPRTAKRMTTRQ